MFNDEIWCDIKNSAGLYQISNFGRVKSLWYGRERILQPSVNSAGYLYLVLCVNGKHIDCNVHVLVAQAFVPNPDNLPTVNHKDADRLNNCAWNLEWTTPRENVRHAARMGLLNIHKGADNPCSKLTVEDVEYIRRVYVSHHPEFGGRALARKFGVVPKTIYDILSGKTYKET
ncbi:MAG: NUMOD4 motif-containing HNH endonuclease [Selenomonadaceae bacterium]|nr:NUMOD4 motif-containing HNH endonuclease [Selenomonadaceae bacterium]